MIRAGRASTDTFAHQPDFDFLPDAGVEIYRTIVDRMEQGVLVYDGQKILGANSRLSQVLECPRELVVPGASLEEFIRFGAERGDYSGSVGLTLLSVRMNIAAGKDYVVERHLPSGRTVRIDCRNQGDFGIGTYTDITQAKIQTAIAETTFDAMAQGLLVHDREKIVAANGRLADILSLPGDLVAVGKPWVDIVRFRIARGDYEENEQYLERAYEAFDAQRNFTAETQAVSKTLLTECRHQHSMMFVTYTDITDARERETQLKEKEKEVRKLAEVDGLTDLNNRRAFDCDLSRRIAKRNKTSCNDVLALLLIDLDRFKPINDTYGHGLGDALLQELSTRFKRVVRSTDTIARIGGDEFAAIIETSDKHDIQKFAARLRKAARSPVVVDNIELRVDASIGIAFQSDDANEPDELLTAADLALYEAKARGRGTTYIYEPRLTEKARERFSIEQDLRLALGRDEIVLHYQVQRDLNTNLDVGYEALMRWQHPDRGLISPADFIPIAEETGIIVDLGRWALRQATCELAELDDTTRVAVNVSPVQFVKSDLVSDVEEALIHSGLPAHRLEIEITEELLIEDTDNTLKTLNKLRDMGLNLSLDDFGSGYSSLAYLTKFPFTKLKIDRCFIERMLLDERSKSLVTSILALASSLNLKVTAEGVETLDQLAALHDSSCDEVQGFLLGRPSPLTAQ